MIKKSCKLTISIVCGWFPVVRVRSNVLNGEIWIEKAVQNGDTITKAFPGGGVVKYENKFKKRKSCEQICYDDVLITGPFHSFTAWQISFSFCSFSITTRTCNYMYKYMKTMDLESAPYLIVRGTIGSIVLKVEIQGGGDTRGKEQEAHGPHRSPERTVQINKHIWLYHNVD